MKNDQRNILFTFDYELFLGSRSGSIQNCLIKPTDLLIQLFENHKINNALFFVDTTYLLRLKQQEHPACKNDLKIISEQLITLVKKGHSVFPHIHPHWLDAVYDPTENQWALTNYSKYRFHSITASKQEELFTQSVQLLREIIYPHFPDYTINGYRAGGWSINPFADFKPLFKKHGIKYEFSVLKGFKNLSEAQYFDFTNCPAEPIYKFEDDPCHRSDNGNFTEYCISSIPKTNSFVSKLWDKYLWKTGQRSMGDGYSVTGMEAMETNGKEMISVELLSKAKLPSYKFFLKENNYMHFISHPKMLSLHNLSCFDNFLSFAQKNFVLQTNFTLF